MVVGNFHWGKNGGGGVGIGGGGGRIGTVVVTTISECKDGPDRNGGREGVAPFC